MTSCIEGGVEGEGRKGMKNMAIYDERIEGMKNNMTSFMNSLC